MAATPVPSETKPVETAADAPKAQNVAVVQANTILHALLVMQEQLDKKIPTSRTSFFITKCIQMRGAMGVQNNKTVLWFDVPVKDLSTLDYARFVYLFINVAFNPYKKIGVQMETGEKDEKGAPKFTTTNISECTPIDAALHFEWFNALSDVFVTMMRPLVEPLTADVAAHGKSLYDTIRFNMAETQQRFYAMADKAKGAAMTRNLRAGETRDGAVRAAYQAPFVMLYPRQDASTDNYLKKQHKQLAKDLSVPVGLVHLLHLWALDVGYDEMNKHRLEQVAQALDQKAQAHKKAEGTDAVPADEANKEPVPAPAPDGTTQDGPTEATKD